MLDRPAEYEAMHAAETDHWWYRSLRDLIRDGLGVHGGSTEIAVLDAGCGTGGTLRFLRDRGYVNITGFDRSPHALRYCRDIGIPIIQADIRDIGAVYRPASFDAVICADVFYFVPDSQRLTVMRSLHSILRPGGMVLMNVPALGAFRGRHDIAVGISERCNKKGMRALVEPAGFRIVEMRYWPFLLSPVIFIRRLLQRPGLCLRKNASVRSDVAMPGDFLNRLLYRIVWTENRLLRHKPFGSSLFIVMRKK